MAKKIIFKTDKPELEIASPWAASKLIPEWYRKMKITNKKVHTIKRCVPVLDAFTSGYMIPLPVDVHWNKERQEFNTSATYKLIEEHAHSQVEGMEVPPGFSPRPHKWINSWYIKTPKGYSTLFVHPLNRPELPFWSISGVVDTDKHGVVINFPFLLREDFDGVIPAGTPMIQAIPFKRDDWESKVIDDEAHRYDKAYQMNTPPFAWYKRKWWSRKRYS